VRATEAINFEVINPPIKTMSNNWFQFKKFLIRQDKTAMKVGTDGVLLGAWATVADCKRVLDIGTGTGLIALMLAQRSDALFDAVEIDPDAANQAATNIAESPWAGRIKVICSSFQDFCKNPSSGYDLIVCNPPFFDNSLKSRTHSRSLARHSDQLELKELTSGVQKLLNPEGHFCVILPADRESEMITISKESNLFPCKIHRIRPVPGKEFRRLLMDFSFSIAKTTESEMIIETAGRHHYSLEYHDLTKEYYLGD
jgi:tRNA1Val (adenine37-N6)-methyltransferase